MIRDFPDETHDWTAVGQRQMQRGRYGTGLTGALSDTEGRPSSAVMSALQQARRFFRSKKSGSENSKSSKSSGERFCSPASVMHRELQPAGLIAHRKMLINKLKLNRSVGFLKLGFVAYDSAVMLHAIEAKNLTSPTKERCDSFVQIRLLADHHDRINCSTKIVYETNDPIYNEKFSFEILPGDYSKRLLIGAFHHNLADNSIHLLGSMSFGIANLMEKLKSGDAGGWFYLLPEEFGHFKHKKVIDRRNGVGLTIPQINQDVEGMQMFHVLILKGSNGFGFSIGSSCPCRITKINDDVQYVGEERLRLGDFVVMVNGNNVSRTTLHSLVRVIRKCKNDISLDVSRPAMHVMKHLAKEFDSGPLNSRYPVRRYDATGLVLPGPAPIRFNHPLPIGEDRTSHQLSSMSSRSLSTAEMPHVSSDSSSDCSDPRPFNVMPIDQQQRPPLLTTGNSVSRFVSVSSLDDQIAGVGIVRRSLDRLNVTPASNGTADSFNSQHGRAAKPLAQSRKTSSATNPAESTSEQMWDMMVRHSEV